jgi:hypothetical protein
MVFKVSSGKVWIGYDSASPLYAYGEYCWSNTGGLYWQNISLMDYLFRVFGSGVVDLHGEVVGVSSVVGNLGHQTKDDRIYDKLILMSAQMEELNQKLDKINSAMIG